MERRNTPVDGSPPILAGTIIQQNPNADRTQRGGARAYKADKSVLVLDVRTARSLRAKADISMARCLSPVQDLPLRIKELEECRSGKILVHCRTQNRCRAAVSMRRNNCFAVVIEGGVTRWNALGFPVIREVD